MRFGMLKQMSCAVIVKCLKVIKLFATHPLARKVLYIRRTLDLVKHIWYLIKEHQHKFSCLKYILFTLFECILVV